MTKLRRRNRDTTPAPTLGISIDANQATGVLVTGTRITNMLHPNPGPLNAQLQQILKEATKNGKVDTVRLSVALPSVRTKQLVVADGLTDRSLFEMAAHQLLNTNPQTAYVCGDFPSGTLTPGTATAGLIFAAPKTYVDTLYMAANDLRAMITTSPITHTAVNGLYLALHTTHAELTLINKNKVVTTTTFTDCSLETLDNQLDTEEQPGTTRVNRALHTRPDDHQYVDQVATLAIASYVQRVVNRLSSTIHLWQVAGHPLPEKIYAHGRGAVARELPTLLNDANIPLGDLIDALPALTQLDPDHRPTAAAAYLAALTKSSPPNHFFPSPLRVAKTQATARKTSRISRRRTLTLAGVLLLVGIGAPTALFTGQNQKLQSDLDTTISELATQTGKPESDIRTLLENRVPTLKTNDIPRLLTRLSKFNPHEIQLTPETMSAKFSSSNPGPILAELASHGYTVTKMEVDVAGPVTTIEFTPEKP